MNLKDILVHIDQRPTCTSRLVVAFKLAQQQKSLLTGIYVIPNTHFLTPTTDYQELAHAAEAAFRQQAAEAGVECDWICVDSKTSGLDVPNAINLYAHYRDLLIISQTDPDSPDQFIPDNLPEKTILGSGRPVLIVPYAGHFGHEIKRILLAWRGGPESSRALHDSMPILRNAAKINVITVQDQGFELLKTAKETDICRHMARFELPITCEKRSGRDFFIGDLLLNRCAEYGTDLLIMGATSQSRRGYLTLGETGRHLLKFMTAPVLMSY
jgi:nucleotide-binding universal stress UspA family protein